MLILKRIQRFNEFVKCKVSNEIMMYGDFYYEDPDDGLIISAKYYHDLKKKREEETFDYTKLNNATSEKEYSELLKQAERELLETTVLDRQIYGHSYSTNNNEESDT